MSKVGSSQAAPVQQPSREIAQDSHEVERLRQSVAEHLQKDAEKVKNIDPKRIIDSIHTLQSRNEERAPVDKTTIAPISGSVDKFAKALFSPPVPSVPQGPPEGSHTAAPAA